MQLKLLPQQDNDCLRMRGVRQRLHRMHCSHGHVRDLVITARSACVSKSRKQVCRRQLAHLRFSMSVGAMAGFVPMHRHSHAGCQLLRHCTWQQRFTVLPSLRTHASKHLRTSHKSQCKSSRAQRLRCRSESHNGNGSKETSERSSATISVLH